MSAAKRSSRSRAACLGAAAAAALFAVVASADEARLGELAAARERWQTTESRDYVFAYQRYCECNLDDPPLIVVTVADGRVAGVVHRFADTGAEIPSREDAVDLYWTIDVLFDKLAAALAGEAAAVSVVYDPERGYPRSFLIDYDRSLIGDEIDLRDLRVESP